MDYKIRIKRNQIISRESVNFVTRYEGNKGMIVLDGYGTIGRITCDHDIDEMKSLLEWRVENMTSHLLEDGKYDLWYGLYMDQLVLSSKEREE